VRILWVVVLVACTDGRVDALQSRVIPDHQRRIGELEATVADLRRAEEPAWWCTADRCERAAFDGAAPRAIAWCPRGEGLCAPTLAKCGAACVGVR
jgi:hypothetical protein